MVLQAIRERLTGILAFAILGILIVPFALVGVNQYFTASDSNIVARVNDVDITHNEFTQSFSAYRREMQYRLGENYDPVQFDQLTVRRDYIDTMIDQQLITQVTQNLGLDVDDETLAKAIRSLPAFQVDGEFNSDVYQSRLAAQGYSPKRYENEIRAQMVISQMPRNITSSSIATTAELSKFVALLEQSRTFNAIMVPAAVSETMRELSEDEILQWYESHSDAYQSEEKVLIEYVELDAALLPVGSPPDDDYLRGEFETQKARFISPEQRRIAHILVEFPEGADDAAKETARQTAEDLSQRAMAGEDFAALAKENSQDMGSAAEGGDLGWVEPGIMLKSFEDAMYELSMASPVSGPVETSFGWHVIKLLEIRDSSGMSFAEARVLLLGEYEDEQADRAFLDQADRLVDLIYEDPTTLESAAVVMGLPIKQAGPFTRAGGDGITSNSEVVVTAFSDLVLLQDSVSDPININETRLVMLKLKEYFPVALKPLDEVRTEIIATLSDNLARDSAQARAAELLTALQSGDSGLEKLAAEAGLEYVQYEAIQRISPEPGADLVKEIFRMHKPAEDETALAVLPSGKGFAVVELVSVVNGKLDPGALLAKKQYGRVLANGRASQEAFALMAQLRANAEIKIYEERIQ